MQCLCSIPSTASLRAMIHEIQHAVCNSSNIAVQHEPDLNITISVTLLCSCLPALMQENELELLNVAGLTVISGITFSELKSLCNFQSKSFNFIFFYIDSTLIISDVQIFNSSQEMSDLCVTCMFADEAENEFCSVNIEQNNELFYSFEAVQSNGTSTASDCITHLPSGVYNVTVYERSCYENGLSEPISTYHNFTIFKLGRSMVLCNLVAVLFMNLLYQCSRSMYLHFRTTIHYISNANSCG